ncbi:Clan CA, family C19, ubiquitin hydrolase-like cysteine peptidase [Trichomonas vaginalis G3]|uniref:ubiquitinyl hydrolase 1 n=1 Tax=Trichomonas vaginalis (strain ATCC PRA-98 / G3) TaxID=412133 RepID=A2FDH2_TRIV3|nr:ubiquitinyl hydrolase protein [Trichomonas vaginalis G3]EAX97049.1 Clan CA, family C19, ubiquitin hydrolase-like cysteine peptidase [Trichomonas vaginalis G3]KAI5515725.1 ubiquitinyl hydrolase protein [Trichomonas vaginalis G3]|eukprot:XP_001309979.1 Clan CA, family C19, ubiquitin hydrolase-like cysteine peptidase [Trichomonas vaginalis G3]
MCDIDQISKLNKEVRVTLKIKEQIRLITFPDPKDKTKFTVLKDNDSLKLHRNLPLIYVDPKKDGKFKYPKVKILPFSTNYSNYSDLSNFTVPTKRADSQQVSSFSLYSSSSNFKPISQSNTISRYPSSKVEFPSIASQNLTNYSTDFSSKPKRAISYTSSDIFMRRTPVQSAYSHPGMIGCKNLGNTCYFNSGIQCIMHSLPLTRFLLGDEWRDDINETNPLGMKGKLVRQFAALTAREWLGEEIALSPDGLKSVTGQFAPQFAGYQQQDPHELIMFMLDGIHEDLNRCRTKPMVEQVIGDSTNDLETSREAWHNHKLRNDSIVVDLFHGQLRSRCICPQCGLTTVVFDPYVAISLPISPPNQKVVDILFIPYDMQTAHKWLTVKVPRNASVKDYEDAVFRETNREVAVAFTADFQNGMRLYWDPTQARYSAALTIIAFEIPDDSLAYVPVQLEFNFAPEFSYMLTTKAPLFKPFLVEVNFMSITPEELQMQVDERLDYLWDGDILYLDSEENEITTNIYNNNSIPGFFKFNMKYNTNNNNNNKIEEIHLIKSDKSDVSKSDKLDENESVKSDKNNESESEESNKEKESENSDKSDETKSDKSEHSDKENETESSEKIDESSHLQKKDKNEEAKSDGSRSYRSYDSDSSEKPEEESKSDSDKSDTNEDKSESEVASSGKNMARTQHIFIGERNPKPFQFSRINQRFSVFSDESKSSEKGEELDEPKIISEHSEEKKSDKSEISDTYDSKSDKSDKSTHNEEEEEEKENQSHINKTPFFESDVHESSAIESHENEEEDNSHEEEISSHHEEEETKDEEDNSRSEINEFHHKEEDNSHKQELNHHEEETKNNAEIDLHHEEDNSHEEESKQEESNTHEIKIEANHEEETKNDETNSIEEQSHHEEETKQEEQNKDEEETHNIEETKQEEENNLNHEEEMKQEEVDSHEQQSENEVETKNEETDPQHEEINLNPIQNEENKPTLPEEGEKESNHVEIEETEQHHEPDNSYNQENTIHEETEKPNEEELNHQEENNEQNLENHENELNHEDENSKQNLENDAEPESIHEEESNNDENKPEEEEKEETDDSKQEEDKSEEETTNEEESQQEENQSNQESEEEKSEKEIEMKDPESNKESEEEQNIEEHQDSSIEHHEEIVENEVQQQEKQEIQNNEIHKETQINDSVIPQIAIDEEPEKHNEQQENKENLDEEDKQTHEEDTKDKEETHEIEENHVEENEKQDNNQQGIEENNEQQENKEDHAEEIKQTHEEEDSKENEKIHQEEIKENEKQEISIEETHENKEYEEEKQNEIVQNEANKEEPENHQEEIEVNLDESHEVSDNNEKEKENNKEETNHAESNEKKEENKINEFDELLKSFSKQIEEQKTNDEFDEILKSQEKSQPIKEDEKIVELDSLNLSETNAAANSPDSILKELEENAKEIPTETESESSEDSQKVINTLFPPSYETKTTEQPIYAPRPSSFSTFTVPAPLPSLSSQINSQISSQTPSLPEHPDRFPEDKYNENLTTEMIKIKNRLRLSSEGFNSNERVKIKQSYFSYASNFVPSPLHDNISSNVVTFQMNGSKMDVKKGFLIPELLFHTQTDNEKKTSNGDREQPVTLEQCFKYFKQEETLDEENTWFCPHCREHVMANKKMDIWSCPKLLVLQLKRFETTETGSVKDDRLVKFPNILDMKDHIVGPKPKSTVYKLYGVSEHFGSLTGGHCTAKATVPQKNGQRNWYYFNDSRCERSSFEDALSPAAYVLFYERIDGVEDDELPVVNDLNDTQAPDYSNSSSSSSYFSTFHGSLY